jgi:bifunctional non-homologous end joining protein LigD
MIAATWPGSMRLKIKARFIEPMLLQRAEKVPLDGVWRYELNLDGFRAIAFETGGRVYLRSRNDKDFIATYPVVAHALTAIPDELS